MGEFRTARCKETIDTIDDLLGRFYGLEKSEVSFVKNYDGHIRKP